jgi:hypothetical protein
MGSSSYLFTLYRYSLYWSATCYIPKETRENSLLTEADLNFVIPERKMYYTFKKGENMKWLKRNNLRHELKKYMLKWIDQQMICCKII